MEGSKVRRLHDGCVPGAWQHENIKSSGPEDVFSLGCNSFTVMFENSIMVRNSMSAKSLFEGIPGCDDS